MDPVDNSRNDRRRGVVLVELSLVGLLFFVLLIGVVDVGQFLFIQQSIEERARAAARWGAVSDPTNTTAIQNMVLYRQETVPEDGEAAFGLTPSMVTVSTPDAGTDNYRLVVQISGYSFKVLSPYLAGSYPGRTITVTMPLGMYD